jgi:signal transduction histidine kinase
VTDNGIGIPAEFSDKVFVIFQRLHGREAYTGTGIGLALCKKIIEHHGGSIWVDTAYSEGTRFRFTIPFAVGVAPAATLEGTSA